MQLSLPLLDRPGDFIAGRFAQPDVADGKLLIDSPADVAQRVSIHTYSGAQIDRAVEAAREAFPAWRRLSDHARRAFLHAYQERLRAHRDEIALCMALEVGKPLWEARAEADAMIGKVDLALGAGARFTTTEHIAELPGEIRHRPLGVLAVIGPFNFPGHLPNGQIVPALLLGNTVVFKPSEKTPSAGTWIARAMQEAQLPPGVFNLVQGPASSGQRLTVHPDIDGILFTGSAAVGARIVQDNAARPERLVALELGGKNAAIALDDCELERTARALTFAAFATAGQRCSATSRLIVTPKIAGPLVARIAELARNLVVGYPLADDVFMGAMISAEARDAFWRAQAQARVAGYQAIVAGGPLEVDGHTGFYVRPSLHRAPDDERVVDGYSDRELFAPDLAVYQARDLEHALALANRSRFGLSASVFTASREAFEQAADALRVGVVHHNRASAGASGRLPFGGIKQSGNHRPGGILMGAACAWPQGILLAPAQEGPLPSWPGMLG